MNFVKFSSLENSYRQAFVDRCEYLDAPDWVSLEKLHGANFSFTVEVDIEVGLAAEFKVTPVNVLAFSKQTKTASTISTDVLRSLTKTQIRVV